MRTKLEDLLKKIPNTLNIKKISIYGKNDRLIATPLVEDIANVLLWNFLGLMKDTMTPKLFRSRVIKHKVDDDELKVSVNYKDKCFDMTYADNDFVNHAYKHYYETYDGKVYIDDDVWKNRIDKAMKRIDKKYLKLKKDNK